MRTSNTTLAILAILAAGIIAVPTSIELGKYTSGIDATEEPEPEPVAYEPISEVQAFTAYNEAYLAALQGVASPTIGNIQTLRANDMAHEVGLRSMATLAQRRAEVAKWAAEQQ